jgi:hypothetical protein
VHAGARCRLNKPRVVLSSVSHAIAYLACCHHNRSWASTERMFDSDREATPGAVDFLRRWATATLWFCCWSHVWLLCNGLGGQESFESRVSPDSLCSSPKPGQSPVMKAAGQPNITVCVCIAIFRSFKSSSLFVRGPVQQGSAVHSVWRNIGNASQAQRQHSNRAASIVLRDVQLSTVSGEPHVRQ